MHAAVRPYATAGVALVGASVIAVTPIAPPPDVQLPPTEVHSVQLTQFVPGAILEQLIVNGIGYAVTLGSAVVTGALDITTATLAAPLVFVSELAAGTPLLNAFGDALAGPIVAVLNGVAGVFSPAVFISIKALNSLMVSVQQGILLGLETFNAGTDVLGGFILGTVDGINQLAMGNIGGAATAFLSGVIGGVLTGADTFTTALENFQTAVLAALTAPLDPPAQTTLKSPVTLSTNQVSTPPANNAPTHSITVGSGPVTPVLKPLNTTPTTTTFTRNANSQVGANVTKPADGLAKAVKSAGGELISALAKIGGGHR